MRGAGCGGRGSVRHRGDAAGEAVAGCLLETRPQLLWTRISEALTTALRVAGQGGDTPYSQCLCAPAQVVWSRCPSLRIGGWRACAPTGVHGHPQSPWRRRPPGRARSKPKKPLRAERRTMFGNRGDHARVFHFTLHTRLRTHDASGVPRALSF